MMTSAPSSSSDSLGRIGLGLFVAIAVLPVAFGFVYSLAYSFGLAGLLSKGLTFEYWGRLAEEATIVYSLLFSTYIAGVTVALSVAGALALVLLVPSELRRPPLSYLVYLPLAIPATVAAFVTFQLFTQSGIAARLLLGVGVIADMAKFPSPVHDRYGLGIILTHVALGLPYLTLLFQEIYVNENIRPLTGVARALGAGRADVLLRIEAPIMLMRAKTNLALFFIAVLGSYEIPLLLGKQYPAMLSVLAVKKFERFDLADKPEAFIVALIYMTAVAALLLVVLRGRRRV